MPDVNKIIHACVKTIVVVDDDQDDRDIFKSAIDKINTEIIVYEVSDCKNIVEDINNLEGTPEIIFLDINMPKTNGKECIKCLFEDDRLKNIPKIVSWAARDTYGSERTL